MIGAEHNREIRIRTRQGDLHLMAAGGDDFLHLVRQRLGLGADSGIMVALQREHHVLGIQLLAIVELHALAHLDGPGRRLVILDGFGKGQLGVEPVIQLGQAVIEHGATAIIGRIALLGRVERIGGRSAEAGHPDLAALLGGLGMCRAGRTDQRAAHGRADAERAHDAEQITPRGAAA